MKIWWVICAGLGVAQADEGYVRIPESYAGTVYDQAPAMVLPSNTATTGPIATEVYDPEPDDSDSDDMLMDEEDD